MAKKKYTEEFKVQILQLINSGKTQAEIRHEYGIPGSTLNQWIKANNGLPARNKKVLTKEEKEIIALKKQIKQIEMERDILKSAALIFAKK